MRTEHSLLFKISTSLVVAIAIVSYSRYLTESFEYLSTYSAVYYTVHFLLVIAFASLIFMIWQRMEKKHHKLLSVFPGGLQVVIRFWLADGIVGYGLAKIFQTQFAVAPHRFDMIVGEMSGFSLTWFYFSYSYTLAVIIGSIQVMGSVFLLFRKTVLIGVIMLLPVMLNIILINVFYDIHPGALLNSVIFTIGLLYLLMIDFDRIRDTICKYREVLMPVNVGNVWLKTGLRAVPILFALSSFSYLITEKQDKTLFGSYKVEEFIRNGTKLSPDACLKDSTVFSRVYFSGPSGCAFSPNPYRYKSSESLRGNYEFQEDKEIVKISYSYGPQNGNKDSVTYKITNRTDSAMTLNGILRTDTLQMKLLKVR